MTSDSVPEKIFFHRENTTFPNFRWDWSASAERSILLFSDSHALSVVFL
jgi:hypothetical protein